MKPVGQQYQIIEDKKVDKDAVLFKNVYSLQDSYADMSPIAVSGGFTSRYLDNPNLSELKEILMSSFSKLVENKDFLLIEGTGHAGVGSIFDLSNAHVADLLGSKVVLVSLGGIGRAFDEIILNKAVFDLLGVEILGVIVNKVREDKYEKVSKYIRKGLEKHNLKLLGCIPFVEDLTFPTIETIFNNIQGTLLSDKLGYQNKIEKCVIGASVPHDVLDALTPYSLFIVPSTREGLIMGALCGSLLDSDGLNSVSGIVLTGGKMPHERVLTLIKKAHIPLILVEEDSFTIASKINAMLVKIGVNEFEKIEKIQSIFETYVDVDYICSHLSS